MPALAIWYFLQRDNRELAVTLKTDIAIVSVDSQMSDGVSVLYRGTEVSSLRALEVEVRNTGNRAITRAEFDAPVVVAFSGRLLGSPTLLSVEPADINPSIVSTGGDSIVIAPLLLNPGDAFSFRVLLGNAAVEPPRAALRGRITGISRLSLASASQAPNEVLTLLIAAITFVLLTSVSVASSLNLIRRGVRIRTGVTALDEALAIYARIIQRQAHTARSLSLANELGISRHDFKSNILLLRIKIENQLRTLARQADLPDRDQVRPMPAVAQILNERGVIDSDISSLIRQLSRTMNRELHELDSYLSSEQFRSLQNAALGVVSALDTALERQSQRAIG